VSEALNRTKRSLDLIPYILEHQGIALEELAKKFNVSTEVLYEDLNLLFCCGLPGYTPLELIDIAFDEGYVSVSNPQELDQPRKLSKQELLRLHLGLQLCLRYAPESLQTRILELQSKISSYLNIKPPIELISAEDETNLRKVVEALKNRDLLEFDYASASSDSFRRRKILPLDIIESFNFILIDGIELDSSMSKTFRIDRMKNIVTVKRDSREVIPSPIVSASEEIRIFVSNSARSFIEDHSQIILDFSEKDNGIEVILRQISDRWLISEIFAYAGAIQVLSPISLKNRIKEVAIERLAKV
jgi:proteasome accessory factor C